MESYLSDATLFVSSLPFLIGSSLSIAVITLCTMTMVLSTTPINFALGALYGVAVGGLVMTVGCVVGGLVNFIVGRYLVREWARRKIAKSPLLSALEKALKKKAVHIILLARLSPMFPFALVGFLLGIGIGYFFQIFRYLDTLCIHLRIKILSLSLSPVSTLSLCLSLSLSLMISFSPSSPQVSYVLGATDVHIWEYAYATAIGLLPGCLLYSWIGASMEDMMSGEEGGWWPYVSVCLSVLSTLAISYEAKRVFDEATKECE